MLKKKRKYKIRAPKWHRPGKIYISPDGGETIYEQKRNGDRGPMVSQSQMAQDLKLALAEEDMHGVGAIELRRKYPALEKAWQKYKLIWNMVSNED